MQREVLEAALVGFQSKIDTIQHTMREIESSLRGPLLTQNQRQRKQKGSGTSGAKRKLSAAGRERIKAAQKARWATYRAGKKAKVAA